MARQCIRQAEARYIRSQVEARRKAPECIPSGPWAGFDPEMVKSLKDAGAKWDRRTVAEQLEFCASYRKLCERFLHAKA